MIRKYQEYEKIVIDSTLDKKNFIDAYPIHISNTYFYEHVFKELGYEKIQ